MPPPLEGSRRRTSCEGEFGEPKFCFARGDDPPACKDESDEGGTGRRARLLARKRGGRSETDAKAFALSPPTAQVSVEEMKRLPILMKRDSIEKEVP